MSKYKLILFDLDGTIADTSPGILNSVRYTQKEMNLPEISLQAMYSHVGPPMEESYNKNFGLEGEDLQCAVKLHKEYAVNRGYRELQLYPEMEKTIDMLRIQGYKTAVATLKAGVTAVKIFESLNMTDKFEMIVGTNQKTLVNKEQVLEHCIEMVGVQKSETVLVGDSSYDAIGADAVGIDFIAALYGFGFKTKEEVAEYKNIGCITSISEIWNYL